ncbi:MAG: oligosaccharide repeat unit polymerase [Candidatus Saccharibacteria bacterium]|nr:oligosaccharide repeat unit polymerase [Candidatus Saccharibacteria bacterium]
MISYLILFAILIVILILSWKFFKKDFLSPTFISALCYLASLALAIVGRFYWNDVDHLSFVLITILTTGLLSFFLGEFFARKLFNKINHRHNKINQKQNKSNQNHITNKSHSLFKKPKPLFLFFAFLISVATIFFLLKDLKSVCASYPDDCTATTLPALINFYRTKSEMFTGSANFSTISNQLLKICNVLAIFLSYFLIASFFKKSDQKHSIKNSIKNFFTKTSNKKTKFSTIFNNSFREKFLIALTLVFTLLPSLLTSSRSILFHIILAIFFFILFFYQSTHEKINYKSLLKPLSIFALTAIFIFYFISSFVGRSTNKSFVSYISFYLGVPIPSFERYLEGYPTELPNYLNPNFACEYSAYRSSYDQAYKLLAPELYQNSYENPPTEVYEKLNSEITHYIETDELKNLIIKNAEENSEKTGEPVNYEKIEADYKSISEKIESCYETAAEKVELASSIAVDENYFGAETFRGIYQSLNRYHITDKKIVNTHEWTRIGSSSNVYTALRVYFADFGIFGVLLLEFVFGFFWTISYLLTKNSKNLLLLLIYANYFHILIDQVRDDLFYYNMNTSTLSYFIIFTILYFLVTKFFIKNDIPTQKDGRPTELEKRRFGIFEKHSNNSETKK